MDYEGACFFTAVHPLLSVSKILICISWFWRVRVGRKERTAAVAACGVLCYSRCEATERGVRGGQMELRRGTETVLVVDDEQLVRELARDILKRYGYTVLMASGGEEAVELYRQHADKIAMVILDILMPDVDGVETFRRIREIDPAARVVISSGYDEDHAGEKLLQAGAAAFVQKPYRIAELLKVVREAIEQK